jgi:penicillin G amidase
MRRKIFFGMLLQFFFLMVALLGLVWGTLSASLPTLDGILAVAGLERPVAVERDSLGIPTIRGENRKDIAYATGFVHAQDRFFQMDTLRRRAAGELSELFGPATLPADREARVHRFQNRAETELNGLHKDEKEILQAYADGANSGLRQLKAKPFEYYLLGAEPRRWTPQDCLLVVYAMALDLQEKPGHVQLALEALKRALPPKAFEFFAPRFSSWDTPLDGSEPSSPAPFPNESDFDLRTAESKLPEETNQDLMVPKANLSGGLFEPGSAIGSNCWVVAAPRTQGGFPILANDPHLVLRVPNICYRIAYSWPSAISEPANYVCGVGVPGAPPMVIGSNGHVVWGLTFPYIDADDVVLIETKADDSNLYRSPQGWRPFENWSESIRIRGRDPEIFKFQTTVWGPIIGKTPDGTLQALHQIIDQTGTINLHRLQLETAKTTEEALEIAKISGIPNLNFLVADSSGKIGWTIMGPIPRRIGFDGRLPVSWSNGSCRWDGWYAPDEYPECYGSNLNLIWNANNRMVGGTDFSKLGDGGYDKGARARQIRDDLRQLQSATPKDMLDIQLDDRALFLERWHHQLLSTLSKTGALSSPERIEFQRRLGDWSGRADVGSIAYRLVAEYRNEVARRVFEPISEAVIKFYPGFSYDSLKFEDPLWSMIESQPGNLLDRKYEDWNALFLSAVDAVIQRIKAQRDGYSSYTVGERNATRIQHPMGAAIPLLGPWLNMPVDRLPGDRFDMPRIQGPAFGSSMRMAVSPGQEKEGYLIMTGGESGNPLSPHYRDCHEAWVKNTRTPFLPGVATHKILLQPLEAAR